MRCVYPARPVNPTPRIRLSAVERRRLIEEAAAELFAEQGYAATTVEQIVVAAGVTKPMLYRHFDSKRQLHMALLERHREELAAAPLDVLLVSGGTLDARVEAMIEAWFSHVEAHPYVWRMLLRDTTGDPEVQALHAELQSRQRATDVALLREFAPHLPAIELEPVGEIIRASLTGLALWWLDHPETPRATLVASMHRVVRGISV